MPQLRRGRPLFRECPKKIKQGGFRAPAVPGTLGGRAHLATKSKGFPKKNTRYVRVIEEKPVATVQEEYEYVPVEDLMEEHDSTSDFSSDEPETEDEEQQIDALNLGGNEMSDEAEETSEPLLF